MGHHDAALPSGYTNAETGFVYLRARYYDPATGQFMSRDPLTATTRSPYGYVGGNPLNATDPLGLFCVGSLCTPKSVGNALGSAWDATAGRAVSAVHDLCFDSWQAAATCTAVVAGTAFLGFGGAAVLGFGGGLAGTAGTVSTYATAVGLGPKQP